jgi:hypothetical protein
MNELNNQPEKQEELLSSSSAGGRRRFVRSAGVLVPVVLTVGSRSAMASVGCLSPSATTSINLTNSRPNRETGSCMGRTPGYWKSAAVVRGRSLAHGITTAHSNAFHSLAAYGNPLDFGDKTMEEVCLLGGGSADPFEFGAHLAAAWCNLKTGLVDPSVFSLADLQSMWALGNSYQPVPGVTWSKEQIVKYLKTTMTV